MYNLYENRLNLIKSLVKINKMDEFLSNDSVFQLKIPYGEF
jgi:hypothetical protein